MFRWFNRFRRKSRYDVMPDDWESLVPHAAAYLRTEAQVDPLSYSLRQARPYGYPNLNEPHGWEAITETVFDSVLYPKEGGDINLFAVPVGQEQNAQTKLYSETSMFLHHCLPTGQSFRIQGMQVSLAGATEEQKRIVFGAGEISLQIGSKEYFHEAPLEQLAPERAALYFKFNFSGQGIAILVNGTPRGPVTISPNDLVIAEQQNFMVSLRQLPPLDFDGRIFVHLYGVLYRRLT